MTAWEIAKLRDEFLHFRQKNDEDDLADWARREGANLILLVGQLADALEFWVERADAFEGEVGGDLPTARSMLGIASWNYAVGRRRVPERARQGGQPADFGAPERVAGEGNDPGSAGTSASNTESERE